MNADQLLYSIEIEGALNQASFKSEIKFTAAKGFKSEVLQIGDRDHFRILSGYHAVFQSDIDLSSQYCSLQ